jgi:hypothetical protein
MGKHKVTDLFLYRHRYAFGYSGLVILFATLLLFAGLYVPGGLSQPEINGVVQGSTISLHDPHTLTIPSMPYYSAQQHIIDFLGISNFSIKLLSLVCALVTSVGAVFLLRRWFRSNIAVLATAIMVTTGEFLFVAQQGTSSITFIMWSVWMLLAASMITSDSKHKRLWKILFFVIAAWSLYTALSIYLLIAIISSALLHPHVRAVLRRISITHLSILGLLSTIIVAPLGYLIYLKPSFGLQLLGIPQDWPPDIGANLAQLATQYLTFFQPTSTNLMMPIFSLGSVILMAVGAWQLFKTRYTARSYTITAWFLLLIPVVIINPGFTTVTFVPLLLLLANGLDYLLRSWYQFFPRNPYARIVGLVPLVVLVGGLLASGIDRFVYGYHYDPQTASNFSRDLTLFNYQVKQSKGTVLVVSDKEKPFYNVVAAHTSNMTVTTTVPSTGNFAVTHDAKSRVQDRSASKIIVTSQKSNADRFYIYKK